MTDKYTTVENGETLTVKFDFSRELETPWLPLHQYEVGDYITVGPYVYECINTGKSGFEIPENLTTTLGDTESDGTVIWMCNNWSTNGSDTISVQSVTATSGITIDASAIELGHYVPVTFTATATGRNKITCEIDTVAGETLKAVHTVLVQ